MWTWQGQGEEVCQMSYLVHKPYLVKRSKNGGGGLKMSKKCLHGLWMPSQATFKALLLTKVYEVKNWILKKKDSKKKGLTDRLGHCVKCVYLRFCPKTKNHKKKRNK